MVFTTQLTIGTLSQVRQKVIPKTKLSRGIGGEYPVFAKTVTLTPLTPLSQVLSITHIFLNIKYIFLKKSWNIDGL